MTGNKSVLICSSPLGQVEHNSRVFRGTFLWYRLGLESEMGRKPDVRWNYTAMIQKVSSLTISAPMTRSGWTAPSMSEIIDELDSASTSELHQSSLM